MPLSRPTDFPTDSSAASDAALLYRLSRYHVGSAPVTRWMSVALLAVGALWAPGWLPGGLWVSVTALVLFAWLYMQVRRWRIRRFVTFVPAHPPVLAPSELSTRDKVSVHVTGRFTVEGRDREFTFLPGFYRRFATGERALLCLARARTLWRIAHWPAEEVGMWYVFFTPDSVHDVRWGRIEFGREILPSIAVGYDLTLPATGRFRSEQVRREIVYLACQSEEDCMRVWADLISDLPEEIVGRP